MLLMMSNAFAFDSSGAFNVLTMSYTANTSVYQRIVLSDTQKAETAINFSVDVKNGGGRPTQNLQGVPQAYASQTDSAFITIKVYDAVGTLIGSQVSQTYTLHNYGSDPGNHFSTKPGDNLIPWSTANVTYTGSLTNARFIEVWMTGTDGAWWAGNYGPEWRTPTVTIGSGGPNVAYNPEFGIAPNSQKAQGWFNTSNNWAFCGVTSGSAPCVTNESTVTANMWGGGYSANGGSLAGAVGGYTSILTTTTADAAATTGTPTATVTPPAPTVTGTAISYTTRSVVSGGNTTTVYRTPVTTTTYSDGTSTSSNGTEAVYQTKVASNVVTTKVVNGVLTTTTTPVNTVNTGGVTTIESNGNATTTSQNVLQGLNYKVSDYDAYTYTCFGILGCSKNLLGPYVVPNMSPNHYTQVASGRTTNGIYVPTNGSFPGMGTGTLVTYNGTITAPITSLHPAGTVYRLYFYSNSDDGFVLDVNGQTVINDRSTNQLQNILGVYTASGWIDVVAGQTYNLDAWYWNNVGGYGMKFYWDYGAGRMSVPNSAFTTGRIVETNTIDTTGVLYGNSSLIDMTGTVVSMYPSYVTIGAGTPGDMIFGSDSAITTGQQTKIDTWTNKTVTDGNKIYIDQISGNSNTVTMEQDGNKNKITATLDGSSNTVTVKQGTQGIGQNEIKLGVTGSYNAVDISQSRNNQGSIVGSNGHYHDATVTGSNNTLTAQQSNTGGVGGHYMETTVNGNQNSITARQTDNGNKIMFTSITGNNNTVEAIQKGTGQHYLENKLTGNGNSVSALQEGSTANRATLDLTNAGGPASVILQQNGGQNVSVTTSCATAGGCAPITIRQGY
jgi:hypothetical protein